MTSDPYPDLPDLQGAELPDAVLDTQAGTDDLDPVEREPLSEADSRLLEALSRPGPHVVTALEDDPAATRAGRGQGTGGSPPGGRRSPLAPVFQEPAG